MLQRGIGLLKFYLDEQLSPKVIEAAIRLVPTIDITSATALGHVQWDDPAQLAYATSEARILVSENRRDFMELAVKLTESGQTYTGILLLPNSIGTDNHGAIARALVRFVAEHPDGVPPGYCDFLRAA